MNKEQRFYNTLQDVFTGAEVEGEGGFINLMKIKHKYYQQIEKLLRQDIESALRKHSLFREELFDKLYTFFSRYFTENGSIYFHATPFHNNIYEKIYSAEKDVMLFWKTQMLYYVKTDRIFKSMPIELDGMKFLIDASKIQNKKANERRSLIYTFSSIDEDKRIVFYAAYAEGGNKTSIDDILKTLKQKGKLINEEQLEKVFRIFEKQSEVDFFIHKNAKAFLQEQFKLWSYQYFWDGAIEWHESRVNQLQTLKDIAFKIIDFISQFEDELVKIWNKPKFVKNSNYVITLDRIGKIELIQKLCHADGMKEQIEEWAALKIVEEGFYIGDILIKDITGTNLAEKAKHLPIDTKYFKALEQELLALFDDLDEQLDGWLVKSENYQALNTLLPKFRGKVQTIYIDPPFNLDSSDQFLYRTNYKDANWATLLENRLQLAKYFLHDKGSLFVRCDYNGNWIVRSLLNQLMGSSENSREIILRKSNSQGALGNFNPANESLFFYPITDGFIFHPISKDRDRDIKWVNCLSPKENKNANTVVIRGKEYRAPKGQHWRFSQSRFDLLDSISRLRINENTEIPQYLESEKIPLDTNWNDVNLADINIADTNWTDVQGYSFINKFQTENAEIILQRVIECSSDEESMVFDFFLGSGTTIAAAHKLGRRWLGVEMGEHFYSVVLPRMKKVLAYDSTGISKDIPDYKGGGFFKYYELEQYEEALARCKYQDGDLFNRPTAQPYQEYVFLKDEKLLDAVVIDEKENRVLVALCALYPDTDIDIAETVSVLSGKWIKKNSDNEVLFSDASKVDLQNLDYRMLKPLIWWE